MVNKNKYIPVLMSETGAVHKTIQIINISILTYNQHTFGFEIFKKVKYFNNFLEFLNANISTR